MRFIHSLSTSIVLLTVLSETKFHVKPLPHARIPIVKLSLDPSPGLPSGIACDIGFENRLALENTRLLMCYAMIDPTRIRTFVLFRKSLSLSPCQPLIHSTFSIPVKVWSKRRSVPVYRPHHSNSRHPVGKSIRRIMEHCHPTDMFCWLYTFSFMSRIHRSFQIYNKFLPFAQSHRWVLFPAESLGS